MAVPERLVASVVSEISEQMKDPHYTQVAVGILVEEQPQVAQWLSGKSRRIGGAHGVLEVVFHAHVLSQCFQKELGRALRQVDLQMLDLASQGDPVTRFRAREPALADYVASNVAGKATRIELCRIGLSLSYAAHPKLGSR